MRWAFRSRDAAPAPTPSAPLQSRTADPTESDADLVKRIAATHLPEDIRASWLGLLRPAVQLVPEHGGAQRVARLGGLPDLPETTPWPTWSDHGSLSYIGEILCGPLADFAVDLPLPTSGRLLFFYFDGSYDNGQSTVGTWDASTLEGARAIHVDDQVHHSPRATPGGLGTYGERWLAGRLILAAPTWEHPDLRNAFMSPGQDQRSFMDHPVNADAFTEELYERHGGPLHQVGGYAGARASRA